MVFLNIAKLLNTENEKKLFKTKLKSNNGLLLSIFETESKKNLRFIFCDFQSDGKILVLANNDAQIYVINFFTNQCWKLQKLDSCTCLKLSENQPNQLLVGKSNGTVQVLGIESGLQIGKLLGHEYPVLAISLAETICLTSSKYEAIIWNLDDYSKLQMLSLQKLCVLKFALLVPISNHILVCYKDDIVQIWKSDNFECVKQFHSSNWRNSCVKCLDISRNGKILATSGYLPVIAIFQLEIWKLLKLINLPSHIRGIRQIRFIPQNFDAGCHKLLAILTKSGIIYYYNIESNTLIAELKTKCEIISFSLPCSNAQYISCVLCSGEVEVYDVYFYTMKNEETCLISVVPLIKDRKLKLSRSYKKMDEKSKKQMDDLLEIDKLKYIIKEYLEFPAAFRMTIWEKLLKLPDNTRQYNSIVNHVTLAAFDDLQDKFPLEDKVTISCLKHVLTNLTTWCPFLAQVDFLPCLLFPFIKVFHKKPIACFELCCTLIINWCQHWFEYHPLAPVNILGIIDNIIMEHDSTLLQHFSQYNIRPVVYSWSLLETAFSEVLTSSQWLVFWDHVFINEPSFLLCAVIAYLKLQKKFILLLTKESELLQFFSSQTPLDLKKFIKKSYEILQSTSAKNHPRQYINTFVPLNCGSYPSFDEYPKDVINFQMEHLNYLDDQLKETQKMKELALKKQQEQQHFNDIEINIEEDRRHIEVEKACIEKIKAYQQNLLKQQSELQSLREELASQEKAIFENSQKLLNGRKKQKQTDQMDLLNDGLNMFENTNQIEVKNLQESGKLKQMDLLRKSQENSEINIKRDSDLRHQLDSVRHETIKLRKEIQKTKHDLRSPRKADITLTMSKVNNLIKLIKSEIGKGKYNTSSCSSAKENLKALMLEKETKKLRKDISQLIGLLSGKGSNESSFCYSQKCSHTLTNCSNKTVRFDTD